MKNEINEKVLTSWLNMTTAINNDKMTSSLPFNEAMVCRYLYQHASEHVIASQLCEWLGMQKSQMNRTLTAMEDKGMIKRERSLNDKRQIYISIDENNKDIYMKMHENTLKIVEKIASKLDKKELEEVIRVFNLVAEAAREETE